MWLFSRKAKAPAMAMPAALPLAEVSRRDSGRDSGPRLVRRVEITVEREWTSTVTRRKATPRDGSKG